MLLLFQVVLSQGPVPYGREISFTQYSVEEGLHLNYIRALYEDSKGRIWIGGNNGLAVFNGKEFKHYSRKDGLVGTDISAITEDNSARIWIGHNGGLSRFKKGRIKLSDSATGLPYKQIVHCIFKDDDGTLWAGGPRGIWHVNPNDSVKPLIKHYSPVNSNDHTGIRFINRKKDGSLLAGGDHGYFILKNDTFINTGLPAPVYSLVELRNGKEWYGGWASPIYQANHGKIDSAIHLGTGIMKMTKDKKGNIWLVTWDKGVLKYDNKNLVSYSNREGINASSFWTTMTDREGNIWFGSWGQGLFKYSGERFSKITEKSGLIGNYILSVKKDTSGNIWMASENVIYCLDTRSNNKIKIFDSFEGKPLNKIMTLLVTNENELIIPCYGGNGYKISNNKISSEGWIGGFCAVYDKYNRICLGVESGELRAMENGKVVEKFFVHGFKCYASDAYVDHKKNIWIMNGTRGVNYCNYASTINFYSKNGFVNSMASCVVQESDDTFWIGTYNRGAFKCKLVGNNRMKILDSVTMDHGLLSNSIISLHVFKDRLVLGTGNGLSVMSLKYSTSDTKVINSYAKEEGLVNNSCKVSLIDEKGKIWIATPKGVYIFDIDYEQKNEQETSNQMLNVKLFFNDIDTSQFKFPTNEQGLPLFLKLPYDQNHITFNYIGICHTAQSKVRYKYKLEGFDKDWSPPSDKTEIVYSNLPPGKYLFKMVSCNNEGLWNTQPLEYSLEIIPPFWKTWWFRTCVTLASIGLITLIFRWRQKKLLRINHQLEQKVIERTVELKNQKELVEEKNKEITDSINYASKIQGVLLPSETEMSTTFPEHFIFFKPKDIVSGDFYWAASTNDLIHSEKKEKVSAFLAVCDSTGHGVPGAFMSLLNMNLINEAILEKGISQPGEVFEYVRKKLISNISKEGQKDGFDGILICMNSNDSTLYFAAANNAPVIIRQNKLIYLDYDKMPVGKGERMEPFNTYKLQTQPNDMLYLYTDGFADQFGGPKGKKFKYKQLNDLLLSIHDKDLNEQKAALTESFNSWRGDLEQVDDVCVIGIKL